MKSHNGVPGLGAILHRAMMGRGEEGPRTQEADAGWQIGCLFYSCESTEVQGVEPQRLSSEIGTLHTKVKYLGTFLFTLGRAKKVQPTLDEGLDSAREACC